jgi:hypothetical protein
MTLRGSCHCDAVRYEVDALASPIGHCHCRTCQKVQGDAYATTVRVDRKDFRWVKGEDVLAHYPSTPGKLRLFCSRCGSHLVAEWSAQPAVIVRMATLDDDPGVRPVARIWTSHEQSWMTETDDLPRMAEGLVPQRPVEDRP